MAFDALFKRAFADDDSTALGHGWVSGVLSVVLGALALGGVICFHFPEVLTTPELRARYPVPWLRALLQAVLVLGLLFALRSAIVRKRKTLAATGTLLALLALLLGGSSVRLPEQVPETPVGIGLDWFLLNLLALIVVFVPLERALPRDPAQLVFRPSWTLDGLYFLVSHLIVQFFSFVSLVPATVARERLMPNAVATTVGAWPLAVQVALVFLLADLTQYAVHRCFHRVPLLWRFHAVHHSSRSMDWLAGSRMHLFDATVTRGLALVAPLLLGLSASALGVYLAFVSVHAVFIHANFGARLTWLEPFLVTPRFHHFHHADEPEAIDKNFAVHLPWIDALFGTRFLPKGRWPHAYGIAGEPLPESWTGQLLAPVRRR